MPFALMGAPTPITIESRGVKNIISAGIDPLGAVWVDHRQEDSAAQGARVSVEISGEGQEFYPEYWARGFAMFNPHASVRIRRFEGTGPGGYQANSPDSNILKSEESYQPTAPPGWRKFLPTDLTSPHWYTADVFEKLIYAHVKDRDLPLRGFIKQFRGLSPNAKAKSVCDQFPGISRLSDIQEYPGAVADLLAAMQLLAQLTRLSSRQIFKAG